MKPIKTILAVFALVATPVLAAETRMVTDDAGRVVEVPLTAERVICKMTIG